MAARRNGKKVVFLTADELDEQADTRASEAEQLPEGEPRQNALRTAAQLKVYASMKRVLTPQTAKWTRIRKSGRMTAQ
jgi:Spy/CpxP family protein refolding chaperone